MGDKQKRFQVVIDATDSRTHHVRHDRCHNKYHGGEYQIERDYPRQPVREEHYWCRASSFDDHTHNEATYHEKQIDTETATDGGSESVQPEHTSRSDGSHHLKTVNLFRIRFHIDLCNFASSVIFACI